MQAKRAWPAGLAGPIALPSPRPFAGYAPCQPTHLGQEPKQPRASQGASPPDQATTVKKEPTAVPPVVSEVSAASKSRGVRLNSPSGKQYPEPKQPPYLEGGIESAEPREPGSHRRGTATDVAERSQWEPACHALHRCYNAGSLTLQRRKTKAPGPRYQRASVRAEFSVLQCSLSARPAV